MKTFLTWCATLLLSVSAHAQVAQAVTARDIKIDKISPSVTTSPQFNVSNTTDKRATYLKWLEIEVEFSLDRVEMVDELTFEYLVEINGKLCPGEVTHVNITKGNGRYSVMYMSPRSLDRLTGNKPLNNSMIGNMWVTVKKQGQVLAKKSVSPGEPKNLPQFPGLLVPKSETPFQVLWWDRYEATRAGAGTR
jgi:hypothetical protein